jgi:anion-transporting  ArsA/GET3 family ATPase
MSKFLKIVEENRPLTSQELDKVTPIKRIFQRALLSDENRSMLEELGLTKVEVTENSNNITLRFRDGFVITYAAEAMKEEETEDVVVAAAKVGKDLDKNINSAWNSLSKKVSLKSNRITPKLKELETVVDKF